MSKKAVVTGITGQDGAYLCEFLIQKGYTVTGTYRRSSSMNFWRLSELGLLDHPQLRLIDHDLTDSGASVHLISKTQPDEVYNLAAQSFVATSFTQPSTTAQITGLGVVNLLEAIRIVNPKIRFYQASTSEMFGKVQAIPQTETTPFYPRSPYGVAKLFAHWMTVNYRESYGLFASSGILFNHESPLRGLEFVTRKITDGVAKIRLGHRDYIELGNLNAIRDWGDAREYVQGMWSMLQADSPDTFVLATGRQESVRLFAEMAFRAAEIDIVFRNSNAEEVGIDRKTGSIVLKINPSFYRPAEVDLLVGDARKAEQVLGWRAETRLQTLCQKMVEADLRRNSEGKSF